MEMMKVNNEEARSSLDLQVRDQRTLSVSRIKAAVFCGLLLLGVAAFAQKSDYIGQEKRAIKALSVDDVQGLLEGRGMGMAKAAELNGYPGPMHVLQMKEALKITPAQEAKIQAVFNRMKKEAIALGQDLVSAEAKLEREFRSGKANANRVADLTDMVGAIQARLRACHLNAHVATKPLLTAAQVRTYEGFRGYSQ
jgi:Spy/CpxP family protein refolding chaperone